MGGQKEDAQVQNRAKNTKIENSAKIFILHFSEASLQIPWCFIPQTKSPTLVIKWLKGYCEIFTYVQEISNQSCQSNCYSPCMYPNFVLELGFRHKAGMK